LIENPKEIKPLSQLRLEPPQFVNAKPGGKVLLRFPRLFMVAAR
jgi:trans-aconitate methyltransferase